MKVFDWFQKVLVIAAMTNGLVDAAGHGGDGDSDTTTTSTTPLPLCVGVRGNGQWLWSHFTSLAQIVESMGQPIDGMSGGSSGTLSMFITESIHKNPIIMASDNDDNDDDDKVEYISFLLKSLEVVAELNLQETIVPPQSSVDALMGMIMASPTLPAVLFAPAGTPIDADTEAAAIQELIGILTLWSDQEQDRLDAMGLKINAPMLNPQIIDLLLTSPVPKTHAQSLMDSISSELFSVSDQMAFIRPGVLNFQAIAELVDIVASFYAGYDPVDLVDMEDILSQCAPYAFGKEWPDIASYEITTPSSIAATTNATTCGERFGELLSKFAHARQVGISPSRITDTLGFDKFVSIGQSSGIGPLGVALYEEAVADFQINGNVNAGWDSTLDTVQFGYWGNEDVLNTAEKYLKDNFDDAKSNKFRNLGQTTWNHVLLRSPAEPGIANAVPEYAMNNDNDNASNNQFYATGGWADLTPGQLLESMGCDTILLIQQNGGAGMFQQQIATLLGATQDDMDAMFDLSNPNSGWTRAIQSADGSICNDWNAYNSSDVRGLATDGWTSPMVSENETIRSLFGEEDSIQLAGCTPLLTLDGELIIIEDDDNNEETSPPTTTSDNDGDGDGDDSGASMGGIISLADNVVVVLSLCIGWSMLMFALN